MNTDQVKSAREEFFGERNCLQSDRMADYYNDIARGVTAGHLLNDVRGYVRVFIYLFIYFA